MFIVALCPNLRKHEITAHIRLGLERHQCQMNGAACSVGATVLHFSDYPPITSVSNLKYVSNYHLNCIVYFPKITFILLYII